MRKPLIVINWKMSMTLAATRAFVTEFQTLATGHTATLDLVICPPATALTTLAELAAETTIQVGAQNLSPESAAAHTGQLSAELLADAGARWVLIGHWEVRHDLGDDGETLNRKVHRALHAGLRPILLLGEVEPEEDIAAQLRQQLSTVLADCTAADVARLAFIYEPSWAIGQSAPASREEIAAGIQALRATLATQFGEEVAASVRIIYGGSVTPAHAPTLLTLEELDGLGMGRSGRHAAAVSELVELLYQLRVAEQESTVQANLWYWYFYQSGLPTARAKELLARWQTVGMTLSQVLKSLPEGSKEAGINVQEAQKLSIPAELPAVSALCWDDELYPAGLRQLPLKLRPALLFTHGETTLLRRPRSYLPPATLPEAERPALHESLSLLLDGSLLPAAVRGSEQAELLLAELTQSTGALLLFVRSGLEKITLTDTERALLSAGRLLLISPLPPATAYNPRWESVLGQVEAASATHHILTGADYHPPATPGSPIPAAWLHAGETEAELPMHVTQLHGAEELLFWLADTEEEPDPLSTTTAGTQSDERATPPPTSPAETLDILQKGGKIPAVLRERLLGNA
ncbi:MAG: triose-phosphate isomerase [Chloroflexota bacterium]|nr:triose-phosphate isomerase [Chloroflexota bacterium]